MLWKVYMLLSTDYCFRKRQNKEAHKTLLFKQNILAVLFIFCGSKRRNKKKTWMELGSCLTYAAETDIRQAAKCNDYQELLKKVGNYNFRDGPDLATQ